MLPCSRRRDACGQRAAYVCVPIRLVHAAYSINKSAPNPLSSVSMATAKTVACSRFEHGHTTTKQQGGAASDLSLSVFGWCVF